MFKIRNLSIAVGAALALGATTQAFAAPAYQVDPNSLPGVSLGSVFTATQATGSSSARLVDTGGGIWTGSGYLAIQGFTNDGTAVGAGVSRLTVDYGLYATFTQTFSCAGALASGTTCNITALNLELFADPGFTNSYTAATVAANPFVTDNGAADIKLATSTIVYAGTAGFNDLGGAFENITSNFALEIPDGSNFFFDPAPFYDIAFSAFNNTSQGVACNSGNCANGTATIFAINQEIGTVDFNAVPEPGTLALLGLGIVGAGLSRRRK